MDIENFHFSEDVQNLMEVMQNAKFTQCDDILHPYLNYQTELKPKYDPQMDYCTQFIKMSAINDFLKEKLKSEVLIKCL